MRTFLAVSNTRRTISTIILGVILAVTLMGIIPSNAEAQDMTQFTSESGFLNLSHPANWSLTVDEDDVVFVANSETALENVMAGQPQTGDLGISVVLMPTAFIDVFGGSGESSDQALEFILGSPIHAISDPDNTQISDITAVTLASGHDASAFSLSTSELDGRVFAIIPTEGVILYVTVVGSADEDLVMTILGTITYTGTADDAWDEVLFYPLPV